MTQPRHDQMPPSALRVARVRAGLTQVQLAARAGLALATINTAERAPGLLSDRTARLCAAVLGVTPEDLLPAPTAVQP
jgi:transcriptional regulator with XRE-family HTH domain